MRPIHDHFTTLGLGEFRYFKRPVAISQTDKAQHVLLLGQTGTGKSTLMQNLVAQDAARGQGFCLIDPHGDLAEAVCAQNYDNVLHWDVADPTCSLGYNPLTRTSEALRPVVASGLIEALKKQWADAWGARMEHLLRYAILALLEQPRADLRDIMRLFTERSFQNQVLARVTDEQVRSFWLQEYPALNYKSAADGVAPIANKLGAFLAHPLVRKAMCKPQEPIRFRRLMDQGGRLVVNLSKGRLGGDTANVLGGLITASILHAAFTRQDQPEAARRPFSLYVDEFHNFSTDAFANLLSEIRKYGVSVTMAQQNLQQNDPEVQNALLGNVGTLIAFRLGVFDTPIMTKQMPDRTSQDFTQLPNYRAFAQVMCGGMRSDAFTLYTLPPKQPCTTPQ